MARKSLIMIDKEPPMGSKPATPLFGLLLLLV
jgi:hypothetical protein